MFQSTPVKQHSGPGNTTQQVTDAQSKLCLVLKSTVTQIKWKNTSTSGTYYALPPLRSHQSVSTNICDQLNQ